MANHNRVWPHRAARGATVGSSDTAERLVSVSTSGITVPLHVDHIDEFDLSIRTEVSRRMHDGQLVTHYALSLTCRCCKRPIYSGATRISLEDLSEARRTARMHMAECAAEDEESINTTVVPMRLLGAITETENPQG